MTDLRDSSIFGGPFDDVRVEPWEADRGRAAELNPGYFLDGVKYLQAEERKRDMPGLFELVEDAA